MWWLRRFVLRDLRATWGATVLAASGVALAVAVLLAIAAASEAGVRSFARAVRALAGEAPLEVVPRAGYLDEGSVRSVFAGLRDVALPLPVLELNAALPPSSDTRSQIVTLDTQFTLLGVDPALLAGFEAQGERIPDALGVYGDREILRSLEIGGSYEVVLCGARHHLQLLGPIPSHYRMPRARIAVTDLGSLQERCGLRGSLSAVLVHARPRASLDTVERRLRAALEMLPSVTLLSAEQARAAGQRLLGAFRVNLLVMVLLAAAVSAVAVFNFSQSRSRARQREFAVLRTLGAPRGLTVVVVLCEALVVALLGITLGLTAGRPLTLFVVRLVGGTIETRYASGAQESALALLADPMLLLLTIVGTFIVTIAGAIFPTMETRRIVPNLAPPREQGAPPVAVRRLSRVGLGLLAISAASCVIALRFGSPFFGYFAALLLLTATALLAPASLRIVLQLSAPLIRIGISRLLARSLVIRAQRSASIVVLTAALAVTLLVGLSQMVASFRATVFDWAGYTLGADLYVRSLAGDQDGAVSYLPASLEERLRALSGVDLVVPYVSERYRFGEHTLTAAGVPFSAVRRTGQYRLVRGELLTPGSQDILLSESAAQRLRLAPGDHLTLYGTPLQVKGVFRDYGNEQGTVLFDMPRFRQLSGRSEVQSFALHLAAGVSVAEVQRALLADVELSSLRVVASAELREAVMRIFDETFAITVVMRAVVALMCALGVALGLTQSLALQRGELATMRLMGATSQVLRRAILLQGMLLTAPALLLGTLAGALLSLVLVFVINPLSFGWSLDLHLSLAPLIVPLCAIGVAVALPAGVVATRTRVAPQEGRGNE